MIFLAYLKKTFLENLREWRVLCIVLVFAPAFVYMMYGYYGAAASSYRLFVVNDDVVSGSSAFSAESRGLVRAWKEAKNPDGTPMFKVAEVAFRDAAESMVKSRDAELLVEIPNGFAQQLVEYRDRRGGAGARLANCVDAQNLRGSMAMALSDYVAFSYAAEFASATMPLDVSVHPLGSTRTPREFDLYVPALMVLAIIMILFTAATSIIRELDRGTMARLMLSKLRTSEFLGAVAINQVPLGLTALALTYVAAMSCGFHSEGSLVALLVVGAVASLSVVAVAVITAAFIKSMFGLLTVGTLPFFVLMFFSECMFPLPKVAMLTIGGNTLYANDVLPTALGVRAFNKILNYGAGLGEVSFELCLMVVLTIVYAAVGAGLFRYRHQRV